MRDQPAVVFCSHLSLHHSALHQDNIFEISPCSSRLFFSMSVICPIFSSSVMYDSKSATRASIGCVALVYKGVCRRSHTFWLRRMYQSSQRNVLKQIKARNVPNGIKDMRNSFCIFTPIVYNLSGCNCCGYWHTWLVTSLKFFYLYN